MWDIYLSFKYYNSKEQSPYWETNSLTVSQEIAFHGTRLMLSFSEHPASGLNEETVEFSPRHHSSACKYI
jgi:hypothetical protein